jgi:Icc-related predicted phosphoesterase
VAAILELQQKTGLKNVLLEKKLTALNDLLEQKEAQMNEVLAAAHLDPAAMTTVNKKLEVQFIKSDIIHSGKLQFTTFGNAEMFPHDL